MKKILLLINLVMQFSTAMESVEGNFYYNKDNLAALDRSGMQKHAPLMILIDQNRVETPTNVANLTNTTALVVGLNQQSYPILATYSLLENLAIRLSEQKKEKIEKDIELWALLEESLNNENWFLFDVPNSQFILLVPKSFLSIYSNKLGFKKLPDLTHLLEPKTKQFKDHKELIKGLKKKRFIPFNAQQLEQVFLPKNNQGSPIWDIFINGHGHTCAPEPHIVGLTANSINAMLIFFDNYIKTGIVYLLSCFAGGANKLLLEKTNGVSNNHNYILILGSINDREIIINDRYVKNLIKFFNHAADLFETGTPFNEFLNIITSFYVKTSEPHGTSTTPQVWLPGGTRFKVPTIINHTLTINRALLQEHFDNRKPLIVQNKIAIFLFPGLIQIPLIVHPLYVETLFPKSLWKNAPLFSEGSFLYFVKEDKEQELARIISTLISEKLLPTSIKDLTKGITQAGKHNPNSYLYPEFISMPLFDHVHIFSEITIPTPGLLQFMRESFFAVKPLNYSQTFLIDKLQGFNDLSINLAAVRILNSAQKTPLEIALEDKINQEITLENVQLIYKHQLNEMQISFVYKGTPWQFTQPLDNSVPSITWWHFKQLSYDHYINEYQSSKKIFSSFSTMRPIQKNDTHHLRQKQVQEQEKPRARL